MKKIPLFLVYTSTTFDRLLITTRCHLDYAQRSIPIAFAEPIDSNGAPVSPSRVLQAILHPANGMVTVPAFLVAAPNAYSAPEL